MNETTPSFWTTPRRWLLWLVFTVAWTTALVVPVPGGDWQIESLQISLKFILSKSLHVCAYALFTILSGWVRVPLQYRWLMMFFLMVHASLTELIQLAVVSRTGKLTDVVLDHAGIAIGILLTWRWWTAPGTPSPLRP